MHVTHAKCTHGNFDHAPRLTKKSDGLTYVTGSDKIRHIDSVRNHNYGRFMPIVITLRKSYFYSYG